MLGGSTFVLSKALTLYVLNLGAYVLALALIFSILALVNTKNIRSLTGLSKLAEFPLTRMLLIFSFLSLSGIPPFAGFFAKFFLGAFFLQQGAYILTLLFICFNLFAIYFYLYNMRHFFQQNTKKVTKTFFYTTYFDRGLLSLLVAFSWVLCFGFLFLEGLVIILLNLFN